MIQLASDINAESLKGILFIQCPEARSNKLKTNQKTAVQTRKEAHTSKCVSSVFCSAKILPPWHLRYP